MLPDYFFWRWPCAALLGFVVPHAIEITVALMAIRYGAGMPFPRWLELLGWSELMWYAYDLADRRWLRRFFSDRQGIGKAPDGRRLPLLKAILSADEDVWASVFRGYYTREGEATRGIADKRLNLRPDDVGRDNIRDWPKHYLFGMSLSEPVEDEGVRRELDYMVDCIEAAIAPRKFAEGRTQVKFLAIWDRELDLQHMPFTFMIILFLLNKYGNLALFLGGFRHYGHKEPVLAPFVRGADAPQMLEKATPDELKLLQSKGAYWWCANNAPADAHPIVFSLMLCIMARTCKRPILVVEMPFVMLRSAPVSTLIERAETIAIMRYALRARGHDRCVMVGHSLGSVAAGWVLNSAPELVAKTLLLEVATLKFHNPAATVNFAFMSRCVALHEAEILGERDVVKRDFPDPPANLPDLSAKPVGPARVRSEHTLVLNGASDCIVPVDDVAAYCKFQGIRCILMPHFEHARILVSPKWMLTLARETERLGREADEQRRAGKSWSAVV